MSLQYAIVTLLVVRCAYFQMTLVFVSGLRPIELWTNTLIVMIYRAMQVVLVGNSIVKFTVKLVYQRIRCREWFLHSIFSSP